MYPETDSPGWLISHAETIAAMQVRYGPIDVALMLIVEGRADKPRPGPSRYASTRR